MGVAGIDESGFMADESQASGRDRVYRVKKKSGPGHRRRHLIAPRFINSVEYSVRSEVKFEEIPKNIQDLAKGFWPRFTMECADFLSESEVSRKHLTGGENHEETELFALWL